MNSSSANNHVLRPCFPDAAQRKLLDVCLAPVPVALAAWESWISQIDLNCLDQASTRLLPLAAHRLAMLKVQHKEMPRLGGVLRHAWANNLTLRRKVDQLLRDLSARGIEHLLLKGLPLAFDTYPNPGARTMDDVDVLVPVERAWETLGLFRSWGWISLQKQPLRRPGRPPDEALLFKHGTASCSPEGLHVDLHWFALEECSYSGADAGFWERRQLIPGVAGAWQLSPADQLLHVCVHGLRTSPISSIRWIADAALLIRAHQSTLDWAVLVAETRIRRLVVPMRHALTYLSELNYVPIPPEVLEILGEEPSSLLERAAHRGNVGGSTFTRFAATWLRYRRMTPARGPVARVVGFPRFLQLAWGTNGYGAVARHVFRRLAHRDRPARD